MMWQRLKNWIIKKLGGYTKAEYEDWGRVEFIRPTTKNIVTLSAEGGFDYIRIPPRDWREDRLICELAKQLKPYVVFQETDDRCHMVKIFRASVKVVDGDV